MARRCSNSNRPNRPSSAPAKRKGVPLSPLAKQMLHDMQLAGLSERTQESYLRAVRKFAQWLSKPPSAASENDLRRYLLFIKNDQQWEPNSLKVAYAGLKFFYCHTCPQDWPTLSKLRVPTQLKLPTVLTIAEVDQLLAAIRKPAMRSFFWTVYSLGLRLQEALHLQVSDIDAGRMLDAEWLRMLATVTLNLVYVLTVTAKHLPVQQLPTCPDCGGALRCVAFLPAHAPAWTPFDTS